MAIGLGALLHVLCVASLLEGLPGHVLLLRKKGILECNNALQFDNMYVFFSTYLNLNPKNGIKLKLIIKKGIFIILAKKVS